MAISSADKLVVVKAFAPGNPLPLDAREIWESLAEAKAFAASNATAYAGQTIKVVENGVVSTYNLVPSETEGENYSLQFVGGGEGGVQNVGTSTVEGNVAVEVVDGDTTKSVNVPVVGALVNPVVDEDEHTLTLTKLGVTPDKNVEVVIPLGGASPEAIVSGVEVGEDGVSIVITSFDPETETESTETLTIPGVVGAVTAVDTSVAGVVAVTTTGEDGEGVVAKQAIKGAVVNASYDAATKVLTLPVVTGVDENGAATTTDVAVDLKAIVAGAFVDVTHTADTETASAKYEFKYKDATGAEQTKTVYETGVRKVEAGSTVDKIKITTADKTGALSAAELLVGAGNVKNPTYDPDTRKITLPILQADGTTQNLEINLGKDMVVTSGVYNAESQEIELTLTDGSVVKIPAATLVDVYTGDATNTVSVSVSDGNVITATVKLSTAEGNLVKSDENGLYVVEADFVATKKLISDGDAAEAEARGQAIAAEAEAREQAIADEAEARGQAIAAETTAREQAIAGEVTAREQAIAAETTAREQAIAAEALARQNQIGEIGEVTVKQYVENVVVNSATKFVDFGAEA